MGCTGGCPYCYAQRIATRFHWDFTPHWVESAFQKRLPSKAARIFVNSMSDVADWEPIWFSRVDMKMRKHLEHTFLMLSKRTWKLGWVNLSSNTMLGYSVTRQADLDALLLNGGPGNVSFLSIEPLLDRVEEPTLWTPKWIIVGAETGNRKWRVVPKFSWLTEIRDFALMRSIPLFFKESLRSLWTADGYFPQEYPG